MYHPAVHLAIRFPHAHFPVRTEADSAELLRSGGDGWGRTCKKILQNYTSAAESDYFLQSGDADDRWIHGILTGHDHYGWRADEPDAGICPLSVPSELRLL